MNDQAGFKVGGAPAAEMGRREEPVENGNFGGKGKATSAVAGKTHSSPNLQSVLERRVGLPQALVHDDPAWGRVGQFIRSIRLSSPC